LLGNSNEKAALFSVTTLYVPSNVEKLENLANPKLPVIKKYIMPWFESLSFDLLP